MTEQHQYIAIDLKSFYASVEYVERQLDPLTTNLVVADAGRTEKTICGVRATTAVMCVSLYNQQGSYQHIF